MTTNKKQTNIPAGVIFTILALMQLVNLSRLGEIAKEKPMFMLIALISLAAYGVLAAAFYTGNRTNLPLIGFGLLAAAGLLIWCNGFALHAYSTEIWVYRGDNEFRFNLFCFLPGLANFVSKLGILGVAVAVLTGKAPQYRQKAETLWFLPAVLQGGSMVLALLAHLFVGVLGGVGPMATVYFEQMVLELTDASCDQDHLNMLVCNHATIPDRTAFILGESKLSPLFDMARDAQMLARAGCGFLVLPCNTAHFFHEHIQNAVSIPLLNIIEETVKACAGQNALSYNLF